MVVSINDDAGICTVPMALNLVGDLNYNHHGDGTKKLKSIDFAWYVPA
jgi:hypothetical protein